MSQDSRPIVGYWAIRGLAQPIRCQMNFKIFVHNIVCQFGIVGILLSPRLLLTYTGTEFEDKMYQVNWI